MDPREIQISDYNYHLPPERIAQFPLKDRDSSKLLVMCDGVIRDDEFSNIVQHLPSSALMIVNDTRVIPARLFFRKQSGTCIEVFCLEPEGEINTAMAQTGTATWICLIGNAKKWKEELLEMVIPTISGEVILHAKKADPSTDGMARVTFHWQPSSLTFGSVMELAGHTPLPPYIKREATSLDKQRYQTIFALHQGSVAAPTAGLHFTDSLLEKVKNQHIDIGHLTLHVGTGTFKPVTVPTIGGHDMHAEKVRITRHLLEQMINHLPNHIIAVGTTTLRAIESLYWLGNRLFQQGFAADISHITQWEPYDAKSLVTPRQALENLIEYLDVIKREYLDFSTGIIIVPGYTHRYASILVTNFHLPQSTLLLLIASFIGEAWKEAYTYAMARDFRFLSYGDGCLLFRNNP